MDIENNPKNIKGDLINTLQLIRENNRYNYTREKKETIDNDDRNISQDDIVNNKRGSYNITNLEKVRQQEAYKFKNKNEVENGRLINTSKYSIII